MNSTKNIYRLMFGVAHDYHVFESDDLERMKQRFNGVVQWCKAEMLPWRIALYKSSYGSGYAEEIRFIQLTEKDFK